MEALSYIGYIAGAFGLVAVLASAVIIVRSTASKTTREIQSESIKALQENQVIQAGKIARLEAENVELKRELDVFKTVPLSQLVETQTDLTKLVSVIADNQKLIMEHLRVGEV